MRLYINPLSTNFTKWPNTLKQFVGKLPTNCLSMFDHFLGLALKGLDSKMNVYLDVLKKLHKTPLFNSLTFYKHVDRCAIGELLSATLSDTNIAKMENDTAKMLTFYKHNGRWRNKSSCKGTKSFIVKRRI